MENNGILEKSKEFIDQRTENQGHDPESTRKGEKNDKFLYLQCLGPEMF